MPSPTLHIYLDPDFEHLNELLAEDSSSISNRPWKVRTGGVMHDNFWLIQLPNVTDIDAAERLFQKSHLRFDTMAFSFSIKGNTSLIKHHNDIFALQIQQKHFIFVFLDDIIEIYDTYKVHIDSNVTMNIFGKWNHTTGLTVPVKSIWMRRRSLEGYRLR